jgi:aminomethyltransferase
MEPVKHTPLDAIHRRLGARMTQFAGFAMPLSYSGIIDEHLAVRSAAGLFDLSHMGEFEISGPGALELIEHALTNSAARLVDGHAQYTIMCAVDGGTIDDLIVYRRAAGSYLLCVNAANIAADREWLLGLARAHVDFRDVSDETALLAVQGPRSVAILTELTDLPLGELPRFHTLAGGVAGVECLVARTGYTGEDGFELFADAARAADLFDDLLEAGRGDGLKPCGLGARDTLRMEVGLPLYGHELDRSTTPFEAGLTPFIRFGRNFIGEAAIAAQRESGTGRRLIGIRTEDARSIARQGYKLYRGNDPIGAVTSGTFAPSFNRPLAIAYVAAAHQPKPGDALAVEIRNRREPATVVALPFYRRADNSRRVTRPHQPTK